MKNKTGIIIGFVTGMAGFLLLFKVIFLDNITPADELAPGIVILAAFLNGAAFAFAGSRIQNYIEKKHHKA